MASQAASPCLTPKFVDALAYAADKHATQTRKASQVPYLGHLLSVAGLVIEADGTEKQAIAALLHDAAEDQGGEPTLAEIREKFGADVASIVAECSDTVETPKPPWRERKERYIRHLCDASDDAVLVSVLVSRRISSTTRARSCVTFARSGARCGSGSVCRIRNCTCGNTGRC